MSKKSCLRGPFDKWHDKRVETVLKSERQHQYNIYWSLLNHFSRKKFRLVICKILRLFLNPQTGEDKFSLLNRDNLYQQLQMQISLKKSFLNFFSIFKI